MGIALPPSSRIYVGVTVTVCPPPLLLTTAPEIRTYAGSGEGWPLPVLMEEIGAHTPPHLIVVSQWSVPLRLVTVWWHWHSHLLCFGISDFGGDALIAVT